MTPKDFQKSIEQARVLLAAAIALAKDDRQQGLPRQELTAQHLERSKELLAAAITAAKEDRQYELLKILALAGK